MRKLSFFLFALGLFGSAVDTKAQGCSDAGFCILNGISHGSMLREPDQWISVAQSLGSGNDRLYFTTGIEGQYMIQPRTAFGTKITFQGIQGDGYQGFGFGDIFFTVNHRFGEQGEAGSAHSMQVGLKLPLGFASETADGAPLSMNDQFTTGTTDIILGYQWSHERWAIGTAWQQPLHHNGNQYVDLTGISTRNLMRKGDVLLRLTYRQPITENFQLRGSLLPIYHLGNDSWENGSGDRMDIAGSQGLTFNYNLAGNYRFSNRYALEMNFGSPLANREVIPDGLLRKFVATLKLQVGLD